MIQIINKNNKMSYGYAECSVSEGDVLETYEDNRPITKSFGIGHQYVVVTQIIGNVALVTPVSEYTTPRLSQLKSILEFTTLPKVVLQ